MRSSRLLDIEAAPTGAERGGMIAHRFRLPGWSRTHMPDRPVAGRSIVTRRAIVDIVRAAVQSSYGVTGFSDPSFGRRLLRWIGLDRPGISLTTAGGLRLDLFINVAYGVPVAEVARQVDSAVRYSLRHYVG